MQRVFGIAGWSGSGKTTLITKLIPELVGRGMRVSTIKHAHHLFDVDKPGKDSHVHREAGATEVLISSVHRWALMHENRGAPEPSLAELVAKLAPVDLVLIEGFKFGEHRKLEVHRPLVGKPLLAATDPAVVAIASDETIPEARVPVLPIDDIRSIGDLVVAASGLAQRVPRGR
ncbi:MAG: molybdopterin-guanine dinucleotide biosynthesis protein B [Alphaproteobacteria bacterium]|nr:molybdopterin-guanine dinucleotide biosynthesis protein B [Alphaproteobacteria bacterium]